MREVSQLPSTEHYCAVDHTKLAGRSARASVSVHDEHVTVRMTLDCCAHAVTENALPEPGLARPDDDDVGRPLLGELDDRLGRVAGGANRLGLDPAAGLLRVIAMARTLPRSCNFMQLRWSATPWRGRKGRFLRVR